MSKNQQKPDTDHILSRLKDFQRATADYVFRRLYEDEDCVKRFLIADEVGLGKTLVARGVIAKAVDYLWEEEGRRIDIVYVCSNLDIARQNINRLNIIGERELDMPSRLTLLPLYVHNLNNNRLNFVSFTPGTSFNLHSHGGIIRERALLYHILRHAWGFGGKAGPRNLLQVYASWESWDWHLKNFDFRQVNQELAQLFIQTLDQGLEDRFNMLTDRFARFRRHVPDQDRRDQLKLIGDLRRLMAKCCLGALKPDIIILDEFQRFKHLLDGEDEMALLARDMFDFQDVKLLLLSATPYKMYTMYHERNEEEHYDDFIHTLRFLFNSDDKTEDFKQILRRYRKELLCYSKERAIGLKQAKEAVETMLRKVLCRTERLSISFDQDAMIESHIEPGTLTVNDLQAFATLDNVSKTLDTGDMVEYWKSAPYLLNLMDRHSYKIKEKFISSLKHSESQDVQMLLSSLKSGKKTLIPWQKIRAYRKIDPGNPRLRTLMDNSVNRGAWKLLWIPASMPYYLPNDGPYAEPGLKDQTKALVFSSWQVVPKVIAMLCSYEAERRMVTAFESQVDYQEERKRPRLLRFGFAKSEGSDGRYTGMSNFTLLYPCLTLASRLDPLEICINLARSDQPPTFEQVMDVIISRINDMLLPVLRKHAQSQGRSDEKWYWAALALLDRHYFRQNASDWLENRLNGMTWRSMVLSRTGDDADTNFAEHVDLFHDFFIAPDQLGPVPADLAEVLAKIALASPAVVSLRGLLRFAPGIYQEQNAPEALATAAKLALAFRTLFNIPDSITLIRSLHAVEDTRYWESVLNYCAKGNLQAVVDEYLHILVEALGLVDKPKEVIVRELGEEFETAVSIRTVNLGFDEIQVNKKINLKPHTLRCRFALRFGNDRNEEGSETRADQVRTAFNSPFRPFILATTSIGQEGLDFHQYCHEIYHWNLPSNPVDLEQREGRIHRYKGHVIRRNIAKAFSLASLVGKVEGLSDPWAVLFDLAKAGRCQSGNDLVPFWIFEPGDGRQGYKIKRHVLALPLSRDQARLDDIICALVAYRMVLGQPRQEDLVSYLQSRLKSDLTPAELLQYRIDLSPMSSMIS